MIPLAMFLLGIYTGIVAFAVYAETVADNQPFWPALGRALLWPWAVIQATREARAYRKTPTGDV